MILIIGAKLQIIIMEMAQQIQDRATFVKGVPVVEPRNDYFWLNQPDLILFLMHFTLFQVPDAASGHRKIQESVGDDILSGGLGAVRFHMECSSSTSTNADSFPRPINRRQNRGQSVTTQRKAFHEDETHNPTQRVQNARIGDDNVMAAKIQVLEGQQANMKMMIVCLGTVLLCLLCFSVLK
ncbi:hypothetical protein RHGRI_030351 [Rhododendron griersonianum]|uniref:Uncharacterized protein n=1 Tax=Rhododendron griersonianum TaxID=479676 RepID=A0AAV6IPR6_9ERIC|nr:hypothetical protein RHGRI_030351 [Rhododendron griersonianum]